MEASSARKTVVRVRPVVDTMPADLLTPLSVYLKLSRGQRYSFLLESVTGGENLARYSFVGAEPEQIVVGSDIRFKIIGRDGEQEFESSLFDHLREHFSAYQSDANEGLPSFIGGAIGYFGFGCSRWFEPSLQGLAPSGG